MDLTSIVASLVSLVPATGLAYVALAIAIATVVLRFLPAPVATSSKAYAAAYGAVHVVANLKAPPAPAA